MWVYNRFRVLEITLNISTFTILEILPKRESNETASYRVSLFTLSPRVDLVPPCNKTFPEAAILLASFADVPLARHAIFSLQRTSAETSGYLRRPITAHFQILEVTLRGDLENFARTQSTSRTFNEPVSVSDLNSYQLLLSCSSPLSPLVLRDLF